MQAATRIPLVANGTVDIECGSTANMTIRQQQVGFSYTFFVPQFKWIVRVDSNIKSADDLKGKTVAVTAESNTALFVDKMNGNEKLGMRSRTTSQIREIEVARATQSAATLALMPHWQEARGVAAAASPC